MKFIAVKTTANQERIVANMIELAVRKRNLRIYSVLAPKELKGYVILEVEGIEDAIMATRGLQHVRGIVKKELNLPDIQHFLTPKKAVEQLKEGFIVEVSAGPFKGEKGIVKRVDRTKNEVTIELLEAVVPIPVTVKAENVRVVDRKEG
ncbi:MAG: transcription elongation factor Spt5 [Archaeoglobales archaeon]|jgi:transcriptional antiterminator NusG|nr:transcription elongation factor Spt5 [Archaeoglobi archaeon]NHW22914.1 transcription elongation factor Spt5 [Archaeoglobales archaeon]TDA28940.1 MAG: transcription elongation factor Spt5 [Archaeoglobi archaeon]TDA30063.1 MAG: transcription elongation factor Spt5 [Archaeoglobi archaeon]